MADKPNRVGVSRRPYIYYGVSFAVSLVVSFVITRSANSWLSEENALSPAQLVSLFAWSLGLLLAMLWGYKALSTITALGTKVVASLGYQGAKDDKLFKGLSDEYYSPSLSETIFRFEDFCRLEYEADLRRHSFSYILVLISSVISIIIGVLIIERFSQPGTYEFSDAIAALAGILPAAVTGASLKIWLETRANLQKTRERVDGVLRYKIRMILALGRDREKSSWLSDELLVSKDLLKFIQGDEGEGE